MQFSAVLEDSSGGVMDRHSVGVPGDGVVGLKLFALKRFDVLGGWLRIVATQRSGSSNSMFGAAGANNCHFYKL